MYIAKQIEDPVFCRRVPCPVGQDTTGAKDSEQVENVLIFPLADFQALILLTNVLETATAVEGIWL